ncbi:beta/alpha barrel domain-containing protein [Helicobacter enhydrae]|uniref:hypothetical protein n=1 Tax=Helicobacter enhydrae TaxID=222136 RepID=UPI000AD0FFE9
MSLGQKYFSQQIQAFLQEALDEDWGRGDLFELIAQDREVQAKIIAKSSGIFSGEKYLGVLCGMVGVGCKFERHDCEAFREGDTLVELSGSSVMILKIERVALNILQHSSGIATQTHTYAQKSKIILQNFWTHAKHAHYLGHWKSILCGMVGDSIIVLG